MIISSRRVFSGSSRGVLFFLFVLLIGLLRYIPCDQFCNNQVRFHFYALRCNARLVRRLQLKLTRTMDRSSNRQLRTSALLKQRRNIRTRIRRDRKERLHYKYVMRCKGGRSFQTVIPTKRRPSNRLFPRESRPLQLLPTRFITCPWNPPKRRWFVIQHRPMGINRILQSVRSFFCGPIYLRLKSERVRYFPMFHYPFHYDRPVFIFRFSSSHNSITSHEGSIHA